MELHSLKPAKGATQKTKRIGRGQGSGHGGTATRGHKGQKSRSGFKRKRNFEGGQMPLQMRLPKRGFNSPNRVEYVPMNLGQLESIAEKFATDTISMEFLVENGIIKKRDKVKVLGSGELTKKLTVGVTACSAKAKQTIEELGGNINLV